MNKYAYFCLLTWLTLAVTCFGVVDSMIVLKVRDVVQTSTSDPVLSSSSNPFVFEAFIEENRSSGDLITASEIQSPGGSVTSINMVLNGLQTEWAASDSAANLTDLDNKLSDGTFTFEVDFDTPATVTSSLDLSGNFFTDDPKITSLANASWVSDELIINVNNLATLGFTIDSGFAAGTDFLSVRIEDSFGGDIYDNTGSSIVSSILIGSGGDVSLSEGDYKLMIEVGDVSDSTPTNDFGNASILAVAANSTILTVDLVAIPEPSQVGLALGLFGLIGLMAHRRLRPKG